MSATLGLDTLAYERSLNDVQKGTKRTVSQLASEYGKASKSVVDLTKRYNESAEKTGKNSKATKELKAQLSAAKAQLKTTEAALKSVNTRMVDFGRASKSAGSSLAGALTKANLLSSIILKLGSAALSSAKAFVETGVQYNAQIERYTTGFTNLLGSAQAAQQALSAIQEDAAKTPFSVESLTQANQLLISAGENAGYSRKVILALGNAVSATGGGNEELSRMASNLQQIANVGKASAIDIKQFAYAGINIYQILADYTGKTVKEVQDMTVSYSLLSEALIAAGEEGGRYYNAMDSQSQTLSGRVSTLKDNVRQLSGLLTEDLSDSIGTVISGLNDMTVAAQEGYKTDGWAGMADAITDLYEPIRSAKEWFEGLGKASYTAVEKFGFAINKFLGGEAAQYDSYEEYAQDRKYRTGSEKTDQYWKNYGDRLIKQYGLDKKEVISSIPPGDNDDDDTPKPVAADTRKLADSITETSKEILAGTGNIVGSIQRVTETAENTYNVYDGTTKKIKGNTTETVSTITDTWTEVVDGTEKTVKKITKTVTDAAKNTITTTVTQTCDNVVLSVTEVQSRIDRNLAAAKSKWAGGIFGTLQNVVMDLKSGNWAGLAMDFAQLIWGEVSQDQRDIISKWADDALGVVNEAYSRGGLKSAAGVLKTLFVDGIAAGATEAGTAVASLGEIISGLGASGGVGAQIAGIATQFSGVASSIMGSLGGIVSMVASNPILAAILGVTVVAGGVGLSAWLSGKSKDKKDPPKKSSAMSYKDIQDAYWYGSMRSMAGYDFRTDGRAYPSSPAGSQLTAYQQKMQASVEALYGVVQQYLPQAGNLAIKLDDGTLVGALAPSMDAQLGHLAALAERGN